MCAALADDSVNVIRENTWGEKKRCTFFSLCSVGRSYFYRNAIKWRVLSDATEIVGNIRFTKREKTHTHTDPIDSCQTSNLLIFTLFANDKRVRY